MIGKRETSISVTDLQDFHNVSDSIKRLAISIDGHPSKSHSAEEYQASNNPSSQATHVNNDVNAASAAALAAAAAGTMRGFIPSAIPQPMHQLRPNPISSPHIQSILSNARADFSEKYELLSEIGRGGFSTVYQCRDRENGNIYAVKVGYHQIAINDCDVCREVTRFHVCVHKRTHLYMRAKPEPPISHLTPQHFNRCFS